MYWLHTEEPIDRMWVTATRGDYGNEHVINLTVSKNAWADAFTIYLNDKMYDVNKEVVLKVDDKEVWRGKPQPTFASVLESLDARLDRTMVFDRKVRVPEED